MTVLANKVAILTKGTNPPLNAFVRITGIGNDPATKPESLLRRFEVSFDTELRFADGTQIDGTTSIMFDELDKPSRLDIPTHVYIPYNHSIASFGEEE